MGQRVNTRTFRDLSLVAEIVKGKPLRVISSEAGINHKVVERVVSQRQDLLNEAYEKARAVIANDVVLMTELCVKNIRHVLSLQGFHSDRDRIMAVNSYIRLLEVTGVSVPSVMDLQHHMEIKT